MKKPDRRFTWKASDLVLEEDDKPSDHRKMSEAEKAYFLKQQDKK